MPSTLPFRPDQCESFLTLDAAGWERLLTQARLHGLAGRWYGLLASTKLLEQIPERVRDHLYSEHLFATERGRMARWETDRIAFAFRASDIPVILLKGAAYLAAGLPAGTARILSDVDILVPLTRLQETEFLLAQNGWKFQPHSAYDDRYYREWMHELPPMQHVTRGSVLDVHHNILPRTSALCPNAEALFTNAIQLPGSRLKILAPADMLLHSIVHGFYGGELTNCWRDALDIHELATHFAQVDICFWHTFLARASYFRFERPAHYALNAAVRAFGTSVPVEVIDDLARRAAPWPVRSMVDWAIDRALLPSLPPTWSERVALRGLYLRSHWVKMPPRLLARHLWTKYRMRRDAPAEPT